MAEQVTNLGRAGESWAVDEVIVLTGDAANGWATAGAGVGLAAGSAALLGTVTKIVQEAEAGGLRTLVRTVECVSLRTVTVQMLRAHLTVAHF